MIFKKNSTRTRISLESSMSKLGGHAIYLSSDSSQLSRGESLADTAKVLSGMVDIISIRTHNHEEVVELHADVTKNALSAKFRGRSVREIALELVEIASQGLKRRNICDGNENDESHLLQPLWDTATSGITPAEDLLNAYKTRWNGNINRVFEEYSY